MDAPTASVVAASIAAVVSAATAVITYVYNNRTLQETQQHNRRTITEIRVTERRKLLNAALQELLVPLYSQLTAMQALFKIFTADKPREFRTLVYLLSPETYEVGGAKVQLNDADRKLLEEIIDLSKRIEDLLTTKGGLVDDPALNQQYVPDPTRTDVNPESFKGLGLFAIAIAHFRVLRLAYAGALKDDPTRYKDFVYPRELNDKVYAAIQRVRAELANLSATA